MSITVMKQALEALDYASYKTEPEGDLNCNCLICQATVAVREAIAEAENQEPVATDWERIARVQDAKLRAMCNEAGGFEKLCEVMDKYERTTPPQRQPEQEPDDLTIAYMSGVYDGKNKYAPQRQPLTRADLWKLWCNAKFESECFFWLVFARAIEAAHGIKEQP